MDKESCRRWNPCGRYNRNRGTQKPVNNSEGLWIGKNEKDKCTVQTVFNFEKKPVQREFCSRLCILLAHLDVFEFFIYVF